MQDLIVSLFGEYNPITYVDVNDVSIIPNGLAGVDWVYLTGVLLFALTLYCVFRCIGGIFKK